MFPAPGAGLVNSATLVRALGRIGVASVIVFVVSLIGVQYARVIGRNVALAHELRAVETDVASLKVKRAQQVREIRRLSDPHGAIPEIHDRLHLVGGKEAIIYLKRGQPQ
jgi:hypothetical protein